MSKTIFFKNLIFIMVIYSHSWIKIFMCLAQNYSEVFLRIRSYECKYVVFITLFYLRLNC